MTGIFSLNAVEILLYSPDRPIVDYSAMFIWLMAVGTIFCASFWSELTASEESNDYEQAPEVPKICILIYLYI